MAASPKTKARNLLNRFPFTDLSVAVSRRGTRRENFLRSFVDSDPALSYQATRNAAALIYCVEQPLFSTPILGLDAIKEVIRATAPERNHAINLDATEQLFNLVRPQRYKAYEHDEQRLRIGHNQVVHIGLKFYVVDGQRLVFQYPQPRAQAVFDENVAIVMMSIMHHAYATGDYAEAEIEMADISAEEKGEPRAPRIRHLARGDLLSREELTDHIVEVYSVLQVLAARKFGDGES